MPEPDAKPVGDAAAAEKSGTGKGEYKVVETDEAEQLGPVWTEGVMDPPVLRVLWQPSTEQRVFER